MGTTIVNVGEAKTQFSRLLALAESGEDVIVARDGERSRGQAVATRFDKLLLRYETTVTVAAIDDWVTARPTGT